MQKHLLVTKQRIHGILITGFISGSMVVAIAWILSLYISEIYQADTNEAHIVSSCRLPDVNGAMTVFVMEDGKMKCWRWK